jgi:hypothetical protein
MRSPVTEPLHQLAEAWGRVTRASRRGAALAAVAFVGVLALLFARGGTLRARLGAGGAVAASVILAVAWEGIGRRRSREPTRLLRGAGRRVDVVRTERALRALSRDCTLRGRSASCRPVGSWNAACASPRA